MLVYSSSFVFQPQGGPQQIISCVARWAGLRANRSSVDPAILSKGIRELRLKDESILSSKVTLDDDQKPTYPYLFCTQLSHGDESVSGRRWVTEIGLRQDSPHGPITCTFLVKTDEVSTRVVSPIQVTRPKLVEQLIQQCNPTENTSGLKVKRLDEESASAFLIEVERGDRLNPVVIVSCNRHGVYPVQPERIRSLLVGIADVVEVAQDVDTFKVEAVLGRRFGAWGGAVNIVFPARGYVHGRFIETRLYRPSELDNIVLSGQSIDSEVMGAVTHRTNLPYSWKHISPEAVSQAILRAQLTRSIQRAKQNDESGEYAALLEEADKELFAKDEEVSRLRLSFDESEGQVSRLQSEIESLKYALSGRQSSIEVDDEKVAVLLPLREAVTAMVNDTLSIDQSTKLISMLFSDRVTFLESALDSAQDSDAEHFRHSKKAFELLWELANGYWESLAEGKGDQHAKAVFGHNAYAQNEGQALTQDGKRRRTFMYRGRDFLMEKHLKIGVKASATETLRIHFEWIAEEKRLVVGHCGKHLDF